MRAFDYVFFRMYKFQQYVGNTKPTLETIMAISGLLFFNILALFGFLNLIFDFRVFFKEFSIFPVILLFAFLFTVNFHFFYRKSRYLKIIEKYKNENQQNIRRGNVLVLLFILASLFNVYASLYFLYLKNQ